MARLGDGGFYCNGNAQFAPHMKTDWCHVCGSKTKDGCADVYYKDRGKLQYIRICQGCIGLMDDMLEQAREEQWQDSA
mgnify:CR=1 FL=1